MWIKLLNDVQLRPLPTPANNALNREATSDADKMKYNNAKENANLQQYRQALVPLNQHQQHRQHRQQNVLNNNNSSSNTAQCNNNGNSRTTTVMKQIFSNNNNHQHQKHSCSQQQQQCTVMSRNQQNLQRQQHHQQPPAMNINDLNHSRHHSSENSNINGIVATHHSHQSVAVSGAQHHPQRHHHHCHHHHRCHHRRRESRSVDRLQLLQRSSTSTKPCNNTNINVTAPAIPERGDSLSPVGGGGGGGVAEYVVEARDDPVLQTAFWYQPGISREVAVEVLSQEPVGSFIVRSSTSHPGCYALSVRVPRGDAPTASSSLSSSPQSSSPSNLHQHQHAPTGGNISNYLVCKHHAGYQIRGCKKSFTSLSALIVHHSVLKEMLPVPLALTRAGNPAYEESGGNRRVTASSSQPVTATAHDAFFNDPDYNSITDFNKLMSNLKT